MVIQTVFIKTLGCRVNQAESDALKFLFESNGFLIVDKPYLADLIVVNSCAVTQSAEAKLRGLLSAIRSVAPNSILAVIGCGVYPNPQILADKFKVNILLGNKAKNRILDYLNNVERDKCLIDINDSQSNLDFLPVDKHIHQERVRALIKIEDGCNYKCSYCIVPYLRGEPRSRPKDEILTEINQLVKAGCKEVVLTGINLGLYQDGECFLTDLIKLIMMETALPRLRLSSIEPDLVPYELIDLMADNPRICRHLHIPLQHGSDRILRKMGRRYSISDYEKLISYIRSRLPEACIGTDLLVGYPEETEEDFNSMYRFLENLEVNYFHVFRFSPRPFTKAGELKDNVSAGEKRRRSEMLIKMGKEKRDEFKERFVNCVMEVLIEEKVESNEWQGLTDNYIPVRVRSGENVLNKILKVRLIRKSENFLVGELKSE